MYDLIPLIGSLRKALDEPPLCSDDMVVLGTNILFLRTLVVSLALQQHFCSISIPFIGAPSYNMATYTIFTQCSLQHNQNNYWC